MRSKLWDPAAHGDHSDLPTPARVVALRNGRDPDEFNRNYQRLLSDLYENP